MIRWGLAPVFFSECALLARRWQLYAGRATFLVALLASLTVVWLFTVAPEPAPVNLSELAGVGESFLFALVGSQLGLVLLAAPAYTAGAICIDKARGNLAVLLITDLSAFEIVLGKLGSRLLPILGLVVAGLPVLALATLLGGIDPVAVFGSFQVTFGVAVVGCALALVLSVWGKKPYEVLLVTYLMWAMQLLVLPGVSWCMGAAPVWLEKSNPFWLAFAPYLHDGGADPEDYAIFLATCLSLSALLTALAAMTLRCAAARELGRNRQRGGALSWCQVRSELFGSELVEFFRILRMSVRLALPSLDFNPVLWRECRRLQPSRWVRAVWISYALLSLIACVVALAAWDTAGGNELAALVTTFQYSIGLLFVSVSSVTSLYEDRIGGSLDLLLTTPLSTSSIVRAKWWGTYRSVLLIMMLPIATVCCLALVNLEKHRARNMMQVLVFMPLLVGLMLAYGAVVTSLGLALATWIKRFGVAVGLNITTYVLVTGGLTLVLLAAGADATSDAGMVFISPWFGVDQVTRVILEHPSFKLPISVGAVFLWELVYACVAALLLLATECTFDRCLGRII
jgi:ABC-type transport system involved in multi-copper enzyme maturation permease subunit